MILFRSDYSSFFTDSFLDSEHRGDGRVDSFGNIKQGSINGIDWKINRGSVTLSTFSPQALLLSCTNNLANAAVPHLITTWRVGKLPKKRLNVNAMVKRRIWRHASHVTVIIIQRKVKNRNRIVNSTVYWVGLGKASTFQICVGNKTYFSTDKVNKSNRDVYSSVKGRRRSSVTEPTTWRSQLA